MPQSVGGSVALPRVCHQCEADRPAPRPWWWRPALARHDADRFAYEVTARLLGSCTDDVLEVRHGAVAGLAEMLPALR